MYNISASHLNIRRENYESDLIDVETRSWLVPPSISIRGTFERRRFEPGKLISPRSLIRGKTRASCERVARERGNPPVFPRHDFGGLATRSGTIFRRNSSGTVPGSLLTGLSALFFHVGDNLFRASAPTETTRRPLTCRAKLPPCLSETGEEAN